MIIICTYPELEEPDIQSRHIKELSILLEDLFPDNFVIHLLPPYPASGDGGFAPNDWFSVRADLGTWDDLVNWASKKKLILDGIYNHVGQHHHWTQNFFNNPTENSFFYAYKNFYPPEVNVSPRGGSVFHTHNINGQTWHLWQTFSKTSFDIAITNSIVRSEISRHLDFLYKSGIFGVRLDGCAYYGHQVGDEQFHHPLGLEITRSLASEAENKGLYVIAQLDTDPVGASYFPKIQGWKVPVVDYAYSAVLVLALLTESASAMEKHILRTINLPCEIIRPPRTHDGILLQSDLLTENEYNELVSLCKNWALPTRIVDGEVYEINSSLPFICSLGVDENFTWLRILLVTAITAFLPGTPYLYLPFIIGDIPEKRTNNSHKDPRALNRTLLSKKHIKEFKSSSRSRQLLTLLNAISKVNQVFPENDFQVEVPNANEKSSMLIITKGKNKCLFACNFSYTKTQTLILPKQNKIIFSSNVKGNNLDPLGFGLWEITD